MEEIPEEDKMSAVDANVCWKVEEGTRKLADEAGCPVAKLMVCKEKKRLSIQSKEQSQKTTERDRAQSRDKREQVWPSSLA